VANRQKNQNQGPVVTRNLCHETERSLFQTIDIESNLRWTPDRINTSPCLQRHLDALPSGEYFGKGYQVVATDGSQRLNRSSTKEPAVEAGVLWHNATIPHRSERVGGQHSSTRAELAAVVMALQGTPRVDDLAILVDSAAARQRLRWVWSHDFRPAEHKGKDFDIIHGILRELIQNCIAASITGTHAVAISSEKQGNDG